MTPEEVHRLSLTAHRAGISELDITADGVTVRLRLSSHPAPDPVATSPETGPEASLSKFRGVHAPGVGIFRHVHPVTGRAPVAETDMISKGQIVAFLQVGSALRPVIAAEAGRLGRPMLADGAIVGYGTPLFALA